jgi:Na+-translocating ferredoxin:NAD+ oxidoreductase RnfC subunit
MDTDRLTIVDRVRDAGVIGAGGAGFPTHIKLNSQVEVVIANGAECEPLVHVDQELMIEHAPELVRGMQIAMQATGAKRGVMGIKQRYRKAIAAVGQALPGDGSILIQELGNFYPAGDEQVLVYDVTGKVVPEGGIPLNVGALVQNIETLLNITRAVQGPAAVTQKYITVQGEVGRPVTVRVPVGITLREVIDLAGGLRISDPVILNGGAMTGSVAGGLDDPVTKTTKMLLVVPRDHYVSNLRLQSKGHVQKHAISACDQCFMCTDFCPRHALGHAIEPHKLILMLGAGLPVTDPQLVGAFLCCECRTCNYACPVHLKPGNFAIEVKHDLMRAGIKNPYHRETTPDPYRDLRRVPIVRLIARLELTKYDLPAPLTETQARFSRVRLQLKQGIGAPAKPVVQVGDRVREGDLVADVAPGMTGSRLHASISGIVREVSDAVVVEADN